MYTTCEGGITRSFGRTCCHRSVDAALALAYAAERARAATRILAEDGGILWESWSELRPIQNTAWLPELAVLARASRMELLIIVALVACPRTSSCPACSSPAPTLWRLHRRDLDKGHLLLVEAHCSARVVGCQQDVLPVLALPARNGEEETGQRRELLLRFTLCPGCGARTQSQPSPPSKPCP